MNQNNSKVVVVGAGPVGALLALLLKRRGDDVVVYERRGDPRAKGYVGGRSINLALSDRGMLALQKAGVADAVDRVAVPMPGRQMHNRDGSSSFMPYGLHGEFIRSVSRGGLNIRLLDLLDEAGVEVAFDHACADVDVNAGVVTFARAGGAHVVKGDVVVGADGSFSAIRAALQKTDRFEYSQSYLPHGYKELTIPAGPNGSFLLEKNALHIWPRASFMLIALPNQDGSFTCTLFFALESSDGDGASFAALDTAARARGFFAEVFPDALALMPDFDDQWRTNPVSSLVTIKCSPWHRGKAVVLGDAAHAIVPFFGQGLNAGFEDCRVLVELLDQHRAERQQRGEAGDDWSQVLPLFTAARKENADAIATLALENFVEMREKVALPAFILRKKIEAALARAAPERVTPSYTMVTFRPQLPYAEALRRARQQDVLLDELVRDAEVVALVERDPADPALQAKLRTAAATRLP